MREWMPEKRKELFELIKRRESISIAELVAASELSKNAARAHLLTLEEQGLIERVKPATEHRGRPPLIYRISAKGQALFPKSDSEVLTSLLQFLDAEGAHDLLERFFAQTWDVRRREYEEELAAQGADPSVLTSRVKALKTILERGGFLPIVHVDDALLEERAQGEEEAIKALTLRECHCPFPAVVRATRLPCRLEKEFIAEVIGVDPTEVRRASSEQPHCLYKFAFEE